MKILVCALVLWVLGIVPVAFAQQSQAKIPKDVTLTIKECLKMGIDCSPKIDQADGSYFNAVLKAVADIQSNPMATTTDMYGALQALETLTKQTLEATSDNYEDLKGLQNPDLENNSRSAILKQMALIEEKLNACRADPTCVQDVEGRVYSYEQLLNLYRTLVKLSGANIQTQSMAVRLLDKVTIPQQLTLQQRIAEMIPAKRAKLRSEVSKNAYLTPDEREYQLQVWNNIVLSEKLLDLKRKKSQNQSLEKEKTEYLKTILANKDTVLPMLEKKASVKCGFLDRECQRRKKEAARLLTEVKKAIAQAQAGGNS